MTKKHLQDHYYNQHAEDVCYNTYIDDDKEKNEYFTNIKYEDFHRSYSLDPATSKQGKEVVDSEALHPDFVASLAKVAQVSIEKGYAPFNWLEQDSPVRVSTLLQAHARHVRLAKLGFDDNQEKKLDGTNVSVVAHHLEHAAYNLLMAAKIINDLPDHDDRKFKNGKLK